MLGKALHGVSCIPARQQIFPGHLLICLPQPHKPTLFPFFPHLIDKTPGFWLSGWLRQPGSTLSTLWSYCTYTPQTTFVLFFQSLMTFAQENTRLEYLPGMKVYMKGNQATFATSSIKGSRVRHPAQDPPRQLGSKGHCTLLLSLT